LVHKKVQNFDSGTADIFGGNDLDKWSDFASGVDVDDYDINSDTQFRQDKLQVRNSGNTFGHKFRSLSTAARTVTIPDTDLTLGEASGAFAAGGTISKSGNGSTTTFTIPHGLTPTPDVYFALPTNAAARGNISYSLDATNITLTYPVAPASGTNNLTYVWGAGYTNAAVPGLTASSSTTFTNKTISGATNTLPLGAYNQLVYKRGSTYYAINKDGDIISSSTTNPGAVIQACVDLMGKTFVAAADYNFPSSGFSGINIGKTGTALELDPNARFIVPDGYTGYVVKLYRGGSENVSQIRLSGGQYTEATGVAGDHLWTAIKLQGGPAASQGIYASSVKEVFIEYCGIGVDLDASIGYITGNTFQDIATAGTIIGFNFNMPSPYVSANISRCRFINCIVQHYVSVPTTHGFKDVRFKDHLFVGTQVWDQADPATQKTMTIHSDAKNITIIGGIMARAGGYFVDNSKTSLIIGDEWNPPRLAGLSTTGHVFAMTGRKIGKMDCISATAGEGLLNAGMANHATEASETSSLSTANGTCGRTRTTAASVGAGAGSRYATNITCRTWNPIYRCMFKLNSSTGIRPFFGWSSGSADLTGDDPLNALSGIILTARTADTNLQIAHNNGSGATVFVDTGIPKDTNVNVFDLYADESATNKWKWALYSQATLRSIVGSIPGYTDITSTDIPASSTPLKPYFQIDSGDGGAKSFVQLQMFVESD
jgi:hypothetical protein